MLRQYDLTATSRCVRKLTFIGDSTARQLFWALAEKLNSRNKVSTGNFELSPQIAKHANMTLEVGTGRDLQFVWDPYLNFTKISALPEHNERSLVVSGGLWQTRHLDDYYLNAFEQEITHLLAESDYIHQSSRMLVQPQQPALRLPIFLPVSTPVQANLDLNKSVTLTPERTQAINARLRSLQDSHGFEVLWASLGMVNGHNGAFEPHGLHVSVMVASQQLEVLLNRICNSEIGDPGHFCCSERTSGSPLQFYVPAIASAVVLGWVICAGARTFWQTTAAQSKHACAFAVFAAVGLYCYLADRTVLFHRVTKLVDERVFVALCIVLSFPGFVTITRAETTSTEVEKDSLSAVSDILPRQQTDEWKGWMQIVILLYHSTLR